MKPACCSSAGDEIILTFAAGFPMPNSSWKYEVDGDRASALGQAQQQLADNQPCVRDQWPGVRGGIWAV